MLENKVESNILCDSAATGKEYEYLDDTLIAGEFDGSGVPSDELNGSGSAFRVERILSRSSILGIPDYAGQFAPDSQDDHASATQGS